MKVWPDDSKINNTIIKKFLNFSTGQSSVVRTVLRSIHAGIRRTVIIVKLLRMLLSDDWVERGLHWWWLENDFQFLVHDEKLKITC